MNIELLKTIQMALTFFLIGGLFWDSLKNKRYVWTALATILFFLGVMFA